MTPRQTFVMSTCCGASLLALTVVALAGTVTHQPPKQPPPDSTTRQRFLEMFARAYFPGRTGQLLLVPRQGDFITRSDPNVAYMHGSPWSYDVSIPLMFAGPAVKTGVYSMPAVQQDVAPTLAAALGVQMLPTLTGRVLPALPPDLARRRSLILIVLDVTRRHY